MSKDHLDMKNLSRKKSQICVSSGYFHNRRYNDIYELLRYAALLSSVTNLKN